MSHATHQHAEADSHESPGSHDHAEQDDPDGHVDHVDRFRRLFWLNLWLTLPVVFWSEMVQRYLGYDAPSFPGSAWIPAVLGTTVFVIGGRIFLEGGWDELRSRQPGMMLLISLALLVAFGASLATEAGWLDELDFWWELAALVTVMLLGHWQEMKAIGQAQGALAALAELLPDEAERVTADGTETVSLSSLVPDDVVLVRPGGRVPADGTVVDGRAELDESMITGESKAVARSTGDQVVAGTVSTDSTIRVRVEAVGDDTALAGIRRLVEEAQQSKSRAQALADRAAAVLFYVAVAAGVITMAVWTVVGDPDAAITHTVTVLVIACPHALGLAIPLVISLSTAVAASAGILVKDRLALERMREVDAVLFDKTGTLTRGEHEVHGVAAAPGWDEARVLAVAGAVEADSEHPLARAIVAAAGAQGGSGPATATDFTALTGRGVEAHVDGVLVAVGGPAYLRERGLEVASELAGAVEGWRQRGASVLFLVHDGSVVGALGLEDEVRAESREAVHQLQELGVRVVMITGDAQQVADAVAEDLGLDEVFAEVLPEDKDRTVAELQGRGLRVAMVGDGVNDAPALARADVGLAIGAGTDVAIESAGVVLASSDPRGVTGVIRLSRRSYRKMLQNLAWGAGYNVAAIPLAAGALAWAGVDLAPALGAVLMSASTIVVAANAQLLRRLDLRPGPVDDAGGIEG
jgi:Cu2+-exporting ATPase